VKKNVSANSHYDQIFIFLRRLANNEEEDIKIEDDKIAAYN
jgi:hypothetical protein